MSPVLKACLSWIELKKILKYCFIFYGNVYLMMFGAGAAWAWAGAVIKAVVRAGAGKMFTSFFPPITTAVQGGGVQDPGAPPSHPGQWVGEAAWRHV